MEQFIREKYERKLYFKKNNSNNNTGNSNNGRSNNNKVNNNTPVKVKPVVPIANKAPIAELIQWESDTSNVPSNNGFDAFTAFTGNY